VYPVHIFLGEKTTFLTRYRRLITCPVLWWNKFKYISPFFTVSHRTVWLQRK